MVDTIRAFSFLLSPPQLDVTARPACLRLTADRLLLTIPPTCCTIPTVAAWALDQQNARYSPR